MSGTASEESAVEALADEFLERRRRGETPTMAEYEARFPHLAHEIRAVFPVLGLVEDFKPGDPDLTGSFAGGSGVALGPSMQRLGDFRLLREVGRGGMGVVYEAEQESLGRRVAIKALNNARNDPNIVLRFHREAKAAARLHHTNIVPVFGAGESDGVHFIVMQFIAGLGLDAVLDEVRRIERSTDVAPDPGLNFTARDAAGSLITGRWRASAGPASAEITTDIPDLPGSSPTLPGHRKTSHSGASTRHLAESVARIGLQVAEALDYAHGQGILHRDVKPSNLLLDGHGTVWVADFGLAKLASEADLTHTGDIVGTLRYMAPERFQGRCDARSDVFSLGLTLYELLARRPAFDASDRNALIRQVTQGTPRRLRLVAPSVPRDLETIVHKAIEHDPNSRYESASEMAEDLRRFLDDRPIAARRAGPAERLARWSRRNPMIAALSTALALALIVGSVVATTFAVLAHQQAEKATVALESEDKALKKSFAALESLEVKDKELRRTLYAARATLLQGAAESRDFERASDLLDLTSPADGEPDLRGFEWFHWRRFVHPEVRSRKFPFMNTLRSFSPGGDKLAAIVAGSSQSDDLYVWDVGTGRTILRVELPRGQWAAPLFGAAGARLAVAGTIGVEIGLPAGARRRHEGADRLRVLGREVVARQHHAGVTGIAFVGEQHDHRLEVRLFLDRVGFGREIAFLHHAWIGQERRAVGGVFAHLAVAEAILGLEPHPEGADRGVGQQDRVALEIGQGFHARAGMGDQDLRVLLHEGGHRLHRHLFGGQVHYDKSVRADPHLRRAGGDELRNIGSRAAGQDGHVQAALGVFAIGQRLVEAALLGLRQPVGRELDGKCGRRRMAGRFRAAEHGARQKADPAKSRLHATSPSQQHPKTRPPPRRRQG